MFRFTRNNNAMFRHPLVRDANGHGKPICKGVGKLTANDWQAIDDSVTWLMEFKPAKRGDVPKERSLHPKAASWWFDLLDAADRERQYAERARRDAERDGFPIPPAENESDKDYTRAKNEATLSDDERLKIALWKAEDAERRAKEAERREAEAIKARDEMAEKLGRAAAGKEKVTLGDCLKHFERKVECKSANAKAELMRRVRAVVETIGLDVAHGKVTKDMIREATKAKNPSDTEIMYRLRDARRFFNFLAAPLASDGLGLQNPAITLKAGSGAAHQRKRRQQGLVETLDPQRYLDNPRLPLYWKALVAVIGYSGLRLAEAASLEWDRVGEVIKVRATDAYPNLKSHMSERDVKPFPNLAAMLNKYRKTSRHKSLVFDREGDAGPTWFRQYRDEPTAADLSGAFKEALGAAEGMKFVLKGGTELEVSVCRQKAVKQDGSDEPVGMYYLQLMSGDRMTIPKADVVSEERPREPARRLRRFWETSMREHGMGELIEAMGGHSDEVGKAHYTKYEKLVAEAKIPLLESASVKQDGKSKPKPRSKSKPEPEAKRRKH